MPIYEYRCNECGHELERIQRMSEEPLRDCPACENPELRRLISAAAFRLKGGGWYETDFKKDGKRNLADSGNEAPGTSDSGDKGAEKKDAKPKKKETTDKNSKPAKESSTSAA